MAMEAKMPTGGADEDLYSDGADTGDESKAKSKPEEGQEDDATEAVLPKSILAGKHFDVGDEVVLKITGIHDEQVSVKYAPAKEGDEDEGEEGGEESGKSEMPAMGGGEGPHSDYD